MKQLSLILLICLTLSACGFHLRGSQVAAKADVADIFLRSSGATRVSKELNSQFESTGTKVTKSLEKAEFILSVNGEKIRRSVLSVSASTGKVEEYQLILTVGMTVSKPGQEDLLASETIRVARDYAFDEDAVLGKHAEEQRLEQELFGQAASQIIRRLSAVAREN